MGAPEGYNAYRDPETGWVEYARPGSEAESYVADDLGWEKVSGKDAEQPTERRNGDGGDSADEVKVSPAAAKLADELDVDLTQVEGTGRGGSITKGDVEDAAAEGDEDGDGGDSADE